MKRYLLFAGSDCYPSGGWYDLRRDYRTPEAAVRAARRLRRRDAEWWHVVDAKTGQIVAHRPDDPPRPPPPPPTPWWERLPPPAPWNGLPPEPEQSGAHLVQLPKGDVWKDHGHSFGPMRARWDAAARTWSIQAMGGSGTVITLAPAEFAARYEYLRPTARYVPRD